MKLGNVEISNKNCIKKAWLKENKMVEYGSKQK